jgi:hypothetical protein
LGAGKIALSGETSISRAKPCEAVSQHSARDLSMIDVNAAIRAAMDYVDSFSNIFPNSGARLEETELDSIDSPQYWLVTMSFVDNLITGHRIYKLFKIDANSGHVQSMKNRLLA